MSRTPLRYRLAHPKGVSALLTGATLDGKNDHLRGLPARIDDNNGVSQTGQMKWQSVCWGDSLSDGGVGDALMVFSVG